MPIIIKPIDALLVKPINMVAKLSARVISKFSSSPIGTLLILRNNPLASPKAKSNQAAFFAKTLIVKLMSGLLKY